MGKHYVANRPGKSMVIISLGNAPANLLTKEARDAWEGRALRKTTWEIEKRWKLINPPMTGQELGEWQALQHFDDYDDGSTTHLSVREIALSDLPGNRTNRDRWNDNGVAIEVLAELP